MNSNYLFLTLSFSLVAQFAFPTMTMAEVKICSQMAAFAKPRVALVDIQMHGPRILAMKMDRDRMMRDLLALSGRIPVDQNGTIRDRFQTAEKQRARGFLVQRIQSMGLTPLIERTKTPGHSSGSGSSVSEMSERFKAVNWNYISDKDLHDLFFQHYQVVDLRKYIVRYLKWPDKPDSFKSITIEMLRDLIERLDEGSKTQDKPFIAEVKTLGMTPMWVRMDAKRLIEMLEKGQQMKPPEPVKANLKKERREIPSENTLVAEDSTKVVNILAEFRGTKNPDEVIEIIAHYDTKRENAGGADDNGVGIVTTLELMRLMVNHPPQRTVRIIFSDREEIDSLGAEYHLENLKKRPQEKIVAVLVPDMFGYSPLGRPKFVLELGTEKDFKNKKAYENSKAFAMLMAKQWNLYTDRIADMEVLTHSAESEMGDHGPYWDANLPAIFIAAPLKPENPANHSPNDKVENMNFGIFNEVAHFLGEVLVRTSGARILPTDLNLRDLNFLKIALKPGNERTDEAAELYFELPKKYYSSPGSAYSSDSFGGAYKPSGSSSYGNSKGSDDGFPRSTPTGGFSSGTALGGPTITAGGPKGTLSVEDIDRAKKPAVEAPAPGKKDSGFRADTSLIEFTADRLAELFRLRTVSSKAKE